LGAGAASCGGAGAGVVAAGAGAAQLDAHGSCFGSQACEQRLSFGNFNFGRHSFGSEKHDFGQQQSFAWLTLVTPSNAPANAHNKTFFIIIFSVFQETESPRRD
jgi:hypothetical protein